MACLKFPVPDLPEFPTGFGISAPALPSVSVGVEVCCKIASLSFAPVIPLDPIIFNSTVMAAINAGLATIETVLDGLEWDCPREEA